MLGVDKCLEVIEGIGDAAVEGIEIAKDIQKDGAGVMNLLSNVPHLLKIAKHIQEIVKDAPGALPELKELDQQDVVRLSASSYGLVIKLIRAVRA